MLVSVLLLGLATAPAVSEDVGRPDLNLVWGTRYIVPFGRFEFLKINREEWARPYIDRQSSHVYIGLRSERLEARRLGSGEVVWTKPRFGEVGSEMAETAGSLLVGQGTRLLALDKYSGELQWGLDLGGAPAGAMAVVGNRVVVPVRPNAFVAVQMPIGDTDPAVLWRQKRPTPEGLTIRGQAGAYVDRRLGLAVLGFSDGTVLGVEMDSGQIRWIARLGEPAEPFQDVDTRPIPFDDDLLVASYNGGVVRLSVADGTVRYRRPLLGVHGMTKATPGETVVMSTGAGEVLGFDGALGRVRWRVQVREGFPTRPVAAGDERAWVGTARGSVTLYDARDGRPVQVLSPGSGTSTPPFVRGDDAVLLSNKGLALILERGHTQNLSGTRPVERE
jgi:outer membrane protein assembly factor BamB